MKNHHDKEHQEDKQQRCRENMDNANSLQKKNLEYVILEIQCQQLKDQIRDLHLQNEVKQQLLTEMLFNK